MYYILFIHLLKDIWVVSPFSCCEEFLWTLVYKYWFGYLFLVLLVIYLRVELLDHMVILGFTFWKTTKLFSTVAVPFYVPASNIQGSNFSTFLPILVIFCIFNYSHPSGCEVVSHCGFDLHFPNDWRCWAFSHACKPFVYLPYSAPRYIPQKSVQYIYKTLVRYIICIYFLPFIVFLHFLDNVLRSTKVLILMNFNLSSSSVACVFGVICKNPLPNCKNFIFWLLVYFEIVYSMSRCPLLFFGIQLYSFACGHPVVPALCVEETILTQLNGLGSPVWNQLAGVIWVYFCIFVVCDLWSLWSASVFYLFIHLFFIFREGPGGRKRGRETLIWESNIHQLPLLCAPLGTDPAAQQACYLTGSWTSDLSLCGMMPNQPSHTGQGSASVLTDIALNTWSSPPHPTSSPPNNPNSLSLCRLALYWETSSMLR